MRKLWANRWLRVAGAAALVAMWPACIAPHDDVASDDVVAERANLDFTLKNMHGDDVRLADYLGRPMLINFWATWCAPCKHEIPAFIELVDTYGDDGFVVLGISIDDPAEDLLPFAEAFGMNYPVLVGFGHDDLFDAFNAGYFVPESWLIRPDGTVAAKVSGPQTAEWFAEQVAALMAETAESSGTP